MRRAAKTDRNQAAIVRALRAIPGVTVRSLAAVGQGVPDLLVGWRGRNYLFEVKDPGASPSGRALTPAEAKFHRTWTGQVRVIFSAQDAMQAIALVEKMGGKA